MLAVEVDWDLFNRYQNAMTPTTMLGVVLVVSISAWLIVRLRARFREDSGRADDKLEMLTQFRELHQQGELTEDEYRLIKSRLAREAAGRLATTSTTTRKSAGSAVQGVWNEGGTEKADGTGQDDANRQESRSTDEPPNQNSATVKPPEWNASGKSPDLES